MGTLHDWIELAARLIEALAVALMVGSIFVGTVRWLVSSGRRLGKSYEQYRALLGRGLLIGLELLVAADIIRTVALDTTLVNVATLAAVVVVRTFLGWSLTVELEGHWPWRSARASNQR
jgi:uncharacterized membrane protein